MNECVGLLIIQVERKRIKSSVLNKVRYVLQVQISKLLTLCNKIIKKKNFFKMEIRHSKETFYISTCFLFFFCEAAKQKPNADVCDKRRYILGGDMM